MNPFAFFLYHFRKQTSRISIFLASKWKTVFYLYLAGIFSVLAVADTAYFHHTTNMKLGTFDLLVKYRLIVPKPDPDIVIVDINEASLAAMAREYGRWPWPRQVLGEFVEEIEKQKPQAIVFDILFSDPDVYNPDSDHYFETVIAQNNNIFFPMLRLDPSDDALSQVKPHMIPGVVALKGVAQRDGTVAIVLPHFKSALESGRLGLHNIYSDSDSIVRQYPVYRNDYGWKIPSLPLSIAQQFNYPEPDDEQVVLNWRGPPFTYRSVSFSDVYTDLTSKNKQRPADEFNGKIIIIGSTAPSLFDIKPTPLSPMFPGVEILATAIDNFKQGDFLRIPDARFFYLLLSLAVVWATAWGFYRNTGRDKIDWLFGISQFILMGISYASINFTTTYINLTGPVAIGMAYFTLARLYAMATGKVLELNTVRATQAHKEGNMHGVLMLIRLSSQASGVSVVVLTDRQREIIRRGMDKTGSKLKSVEILKGGPQKGLWDLFEDTLAISWIRRPDDEDSRQRIARDIAEIQRVIGPLLHQHSESMENDVDWFIHEASVAGGKGARDSWRALFAETTLRWHETKEHH